MKTNNQNIKFIIKGKEREVSRDALLQSPELTEKDYEIGVAACTVLLIGSVIALAIIRKTWSYGTFGAISVILLAILIYDIINLIRKNLVINKIKQGNGIKIQILEKLDSENEKRIKHLNNGGEVEIKGTYEIKWKQESTIVNIGKDNNGQTIICYCTSDFIRNQFLEWGDLTGVSLIVILDEENKPIKFISKYLLNPGRSYWNFASRTYEINNDGKLYYYGEDNEKFLLDENTTPAYITNFIQNYLRKPNLIQQDLQSYETRQQNLIKRYQEAEGNAISDKYKVKASFTDSKLSMNLTVDIPRNISKSINDTDQSQLEVKKSVESSI